MKQWNSQCQFYCTVQPFLYLTLPFVMPFSDAYICYQNAVNTRALSGNSCLPLSVFVYKGIVSLVQSWGHCLLCACGYKGGYSTPFTDKAMKLVLPKAQHLHCFISSNRQQLTCAQR